MSGGRYLLLFLDERAEPGWLELDDGVVRRRGRGSDAPPPPPDDTLEQEVVAVVPATDVTLHWIDLPDLAPAQALAAARLLAVDASAEPFDRLHVAVAPNGSESEPRAMAVASAGRMAQWLGRAAALGHDPDRIVPESLLIAAPDQGVRRIACGAVDIVRGPATAFAAEPELAALATGGAPPEPFDADRFERGLAAQLAAMPLDLRQGDFAKRRRFRLDWPHIRRLALLGAAILLATLAVQFALMLRYSYAADRLEREVDLAARRALPRATALANPPAQLAERLAELRGGGAGFGATAAAAFAAVRDTPDIDLAALAFEPDGSLRLSVIAGSASDVAALRQRLTGAGFSVSGGDTRPGGGRQLADLTVRAP